MRALVLVMAAVLALPPGADAKRGKKQRRGVMVARVTRGKAVLPPVFGAPLRVPVVAPPPAPVPPATPVEIPTATPAPAPAPGSEVPADNPRSVSVRSTEFRFSLSQPSVLAGDVRIQFDNSRAEDPHSLSYDGPAGGAFAQVGAGAVVRYTVALTAGTYRLYCPLPEHEALGMKATLSVR